MRLARLEYTARGTTLIAITVLSLFATLLVADYRASLAAGMLLAPLLVDALLKLTGLPALEVRVHSRRTRVGAPFLEQLELVNHSRRVVRDVRLLEVHVGLASETVLVESLGSGESVAIALPMRARMRFRAPRRRFLLDTQWPLGFVRAQQELELDAELIVEPARVELPAQPPASRVLALSEQRPEARVAGLEFFALREYVAGDDLRHVHALRSAATGTLLRQELRDAHDEDLALVLDLRVAAGARLTRGGRRFEWGLSIAAAIVDERRGAGRRLVCHVLGTEPRRFVVDHEDVAAELLALLAEARPVRYRPLAAASREALRAQPQCRWIAAGGNRAEPDTLGLRVVLLEPDAVEAWQ